MPTEFKTWSDIFRFLSSENDDSSVPNLEYDSKLALKLPHINTHMENNIIQKNNQF